MAKQPQNQPTVKIDGVSPRTLKINSTGIETKVVGSGFTTGMRFVVFLPQSDVNEDTNIIIGQPLPDDIQPTEFPVTITVNKTPIGLRKVAIKQGDAVKALLAEGVEVTF